jgi:hypothetical protein
VEFLHRVIQRCEADYERKCTEKFSARKLVLGGCGSQKCGGFLHFFFPKNLAARPTSMETDDG